MNLRERPNLTDRALQAWSFAHELAQRRGHAEFASVHLALALLHQREGAAMGVLYSLGVPLEELERDLGAALPAPGPAQFALEPTGGSVPLEVLDAGGNLVRSTTSPGNAWSPSAEQFTVQARLEARELGAPYCGTEHLLLAVLRDEQSTPAQLLARRGVHFDDARVELLRIYNRRPESHIDF